MLVACEGLNCSKCYPKGTAENEIKRAEKQRKEMGCEEPVPLPQYQDSETGEYYYRCPVALVNETSWFLVDLFNYMEQGFLPFEGGIMNQPAYYMKRLSFIRGVKNKFDRDAQEKRK